MQNNQMNSFDKMSPTSGDENRFKYQQSMPVVVEIEENENSMPSANDMKMMRQFGFENGEHDALDEAIDQEYGLNA